MRKNLAMSSVFLVVGVAFGYGAGQWQHRREMAAADDLVARYRVIASAATPFASELVIVPDAQLQRRAREAAARLDALRTTFETTTGAARRQLIAGTPLRRTVRAFDKARLVRAIESHAAPHPDDQFEIEFGGEQFVVSRRDIRHAANRFGAESDPPRLSGRLVPDDTGCRKPSTSIVIETRLLFRSRPSRKTPTWPRRRRRAGRSSART
jgi:hypothetical protein